MGECVHRICLDREFDPALSSLSHGNLFLHYLLCGEKLQMINSVFRLVFVVCRLWLADGDILFTAVAVERL